MKNSNSKFYIIGGGIAGLSAAVYLIQEGKINGKNIIIYDKAKRFGGALDGKYSKKGHGYKMRGIRVFEDTAYTCTMDLLSRIPNSNNKNKDLKKDFLKHNKKTTVYFNSRLIENGKVVDARKFNLKFSDRIKIVKLLFTPESKLWGVKINDYFSPDFFTSNFWYEFSTVFAFQPWHSLMEARRYIFRSIHSCQYFDTLEPLKVTKNNQYEDVILPIIDYLKLNNVKLKTSTKIIDINFKKELNKKRVIGFEIEKNNKKTKIKLCENDFAFVSLGSMISNSSIGTMNKPAIEENKKSVSRGLWEKISKRNIDFGRPKNYSTKLSKTKWTSFTLTINNSKVLDLFDKFITPDTVFGGTTIIDSNWYISIGIHPEPIFKKQDKSISIIWGYGLSSEKRGNFVKKKMSECSGKEIIEEIVRHLGLEKDLDFILENTVCIPCITPYVTTHFLPRNKGDRPKVIPDSSENFAFLGQYTEILDDIVFTVEYSVRSAQIAVYGLLGIDKKVNPVYKGIRSPKVLLNAIKTIFR